MSQEIDKLLADVQVRLYRIRALVDGITEAACDASLIGEERVRTVGMIDSFAALTGEQAEAALEMCDQIAVLSLTARQPTAGEA